MNSLSWPDATVPWINYVMLWFHAKFVEVNIKERDLSVQGSMLSVVCCWVTSKSETINNNYDNDRSACPLGNATKSFYGYTIFMCKIKKWDIKF